MTAPEPAAYESLERRLDEVLGPQDAGTLRTMLSRLATKEDLGLVQLDLADFKKDVKHEFTLVRAEMVSMKHEIIGAFESKINAAITSQTKPLLITIFGTAVVFAASMLAAVLLLA